jgi:hypothetical protein
VLLLLFTIFSGFNYCLSALISSKTKEKVKDLFSGSSFGFKASLLLMFELVNASAIKCDVVVLVTIVTPYVGRLRILRRLAYTSGNRL